MMHQPEDQSVVYFLEFGPLVTETRWNPNKEVFAYHECFGVRVAHYNRDLGRAGGSPACPSREVHALER